MNYKIETFAAADQITGAIVSGECAIAALPTNAAANLYKKSEGKIQLLAINTLGVLYLLDNGEGVTDFESLKGKTIYLPGAGSNPEFITAALLEANGLTSDDVTLDTTTYPSPDALSTAVTAGEAKLAVLPEPKVTVVCSGNADVKVAMNFTTEWEKVYGENTLAQGCLVVNTAFAKAHPAEVAKFLDDYKASVEYIAAGSDEAINAIVEAGILPKAPVAKKALPNCNICFIEGADMKAAISVFYEKLHASNPKSIAAIPDDAFYFAR
jgi:NitT/TauT family transport system substrate-binding protein